MNRAARRRLRRQAQQEGVALMRPSPGPGFQPIDDFIDYRPARRSTNAVRITRTGTISIKRTLWAALGNPSHARLMWSPTRQTIGIRAAAAHEPGALQATISADRAGLAALTFARVNGITAHFEHQPVWVHADIWDGILYLPLDQSEPSVGGGAA